MSVLLRCSLTASFAVDLHDQKAAKDEEEQRRFARGMSPSSDMRRKRSLSLQDIIMGLGVKMGILVLSQQLVGLKVEVEQ